MIARTKAPRRSELVIYPRCHVAVCTAYDRIEVRIAVEVLARNVVVDETLRLSNALLCTRRDAAICALLHPGILLQVRLVGIICCLRLFQVVEDIGLRWRPRLAFLNG